MAGEREPKSNINPDELLAKMERRQQRKFWRPIALYESAYDQETIPTEIGEALVESFNQSVRPEPTEEDIRGQQIKEQARADLTSEERESLDVEEIIRKLKKEKIMSGKINLFLYLAQMGEVDSAKIEKLLDDKPRLIAPILVGINEREERQKKARRKIQSILQRRSESEPHE